MDAENMKIWCWIIPILVGLISAYLGYLLGKAKGSESANTNEQLKKLEAESSKLQADLEACRKKLDGSKRKDKSNAPSTSASLSAETPLIQGFDAAAAKAALGKRVKQDDLKIVEGIGPKIEGLFHNFNIKTWKALSEVSTDKCQEVLNSGGDRYRIHDPASWPMQAKMALKGQWKELAKWQDDHKSGKF